MTDNQSPTGYSLDKVISNQSLQKGWCCGCMALGVSAINTASEKEPDDSTARNLQRPDHCPPGTPKPSEGARVSVSIEPHPIPTAQDEAFLKALESAPEDDEPLTSEDERAIEEAERSIREEGTGFRGSRSSANSTNAVTGVLQGGLAHIPSPVFDACPNMLPRGFFQPVTWQLSDNRSVQKSDKPH